MTKGSRAELAELPTSDLVERALEDAQELIRLEILLAKQELVTEVQRLRLSLIGLALAFGGVIAAVSILVSTILVRSSAPTWLLCVVGAAVFALSVAVVGLSYRGLPKQLFVRTRERLEGDIHRIKEHLS